MSGPDAHDRGGRALADDQFGGELVGHSSADLPLRGSVVELVEREHYLTASTIE